MFRLGGDVITTESAREFSSAAKGETLEDTIRIVEGYSDVIVMRHYESGSARRAANVASVPIINAGDGPGQHPTQALLDIYTIRKEIGRLDDFKIAMVGDLANGRTTRSLAYLLSKYKNVKVYFVAPRVVKMKDDIKAHLDENAVKWEEVEDLIAVAREVDVVYQTRIQKEGAGTVEIAGQSPLGIVEGTFNGGTYNERPATAEFLRGLGAKSIGRASLETYMKTFKLLTKDGTAPADPPTPQP